MVNLTKDLLAQSNGHLSARDYNEHDEPSKYFFPFPKKRLPFARLVVLGMCSGPPWWLQRLGGRGLNWPRISCCMA